MSMETNEQLQIAFDLVANTGANLFLTGKAGTGKTTFLRNLLQKISKRHIVVAPTGVAAMNAGGVTIHSFFQLSTEPFLPGFKHESKFNFRQSKLNIIRSLDLLVIDEISMVRADLLDAVDDVLRRIRRDTRPFGGVQLLMIGDLQQLPPVVTDKEQGLLSQFYSSPFFFHSIALTKSNYCCVELKKVYRQTDQKFIDLLNAVRDGKVTDEVLHQLNSRYQPAFNPPASDHYIRLTTHKESARQINDQQLANLTSRTYTYKAAVVNNFPSFSYPTDENLTLRVGAQVMFNKNDTSAYHDFYNGKIGTVCSLTDEKVEVQFEDGKIIEVPKMKWTNVKYEINSITKAIEEKEEGSFTQYPLQLAWAITIHKSQGLTFDRVVLDASNAFTHGQVYVALSRCRSLQGLVLSSLLPRSSVINEGEVNNFVSNIHEPTQPEMSQMKLDYYLTLLREQFSFWSLNATLLAIERVYDEFLYKIYPRKVEAIKQILSSFQSDILNVGDKFGNQINQLVLSQSDLLQERVTKGAQYFIDKLDNLQEQMSHLTSVEILAKDVKDKMQTLADALETELRVKLATLKVSAEKFTIESYLEQKGKASVKEEPKKTPKATATTVARDESDYRYPLFYRALRAWRSQEAKSYNYPAYLILSQQTFVEIIDKRPRTKQELKAIPGFGPSKEKYIDRILEFTNNDRYFTQVNDVDDTVVQRPSEKKKEEKIKKEPKLSTQEISCQMFLDGKTVKEIAEERGLQPTTIYSHLAEGVSKGQINIFDVLDSPRVSMIAEEFRKHKGKEHSLKKTLKETFESLSGEVTYGEIKMVASQPGFNKEN